MNNDKMKSSITNFDKTKNGITISREQFFNFIKNKEDTEGNISRSTQHYLDYFDQYQKTGKKRGWNWGGYIAYGRFFYIQIVINCVIITVLMSLIEERFILNSLFVLGIEIFKFYFFYLIIFSNIPFMMYCDYIYLYYANKQISKGVVKGGLSVGAYFFPIFLASPLSVILFLFLKGWFLMIIK